MRIKDGVTIVVITTLVITLIFCVHTLLERQADNGQEITLCNPPCEDDEVCNDELITCQGSIEYEDYIHDKNYNG